MKLSEAGFRFPQIQFQVLSLTYIHDREGILSYDRGNNPIPGVRQGFFQDSQQYIEDQWVP